MAFNMPAVPEYRTPEDKYSANPLGPLAQKSKFFTDNPWTDPYADFNKNAASQAGAWNTKAMGMDPMGPNGILSSPDKFNSAFDFSYPDINNPGTTAGIRKWGSVLDSSNAIQAAIDKIGNTGIPRASYGVGDSDPGALLRKQAIQTAANQYQGNVGQAMDYMQKNAAFNQQNAGMYLDAISKAYGITTEMAAKMMGLNLEGLKSSDASGSDYRKDAYGAYGQDVDTFNNANLGASQREYDIKQRNQTASDAQFKRDQTASGLASLTAGVAQGAAKLGSNSEWGWNTGMAPIWQQQAGIKPGTYGSSGGGGVKATTNTAKPGMTSYAEDDARSMAGWQGGQSNYAQKQLWGVG